MKKLGFGELELAILKAMQKLQRATVREVFEDLGGEGGYTTVMTVMSRLVKKGELSRKREGKHYVYWVPSQSSPTSKKVLKRITDKIFGGRKTAMVSYLLESDQGITEKELDDIEQLIQKLRAERENG